MHLGEATFSSLTAAEIIYDNRYDNPAIKAIKEIYKMVTQCHPFNSFFFFVKEFFFTKLLFMLECDGYIIILNELYLYFFSFQFLMIYII